MDLNPDHSNSPSTITKKPHLGKQILEDDGNGIDRISQLPDEILCHILSLMPTKYAAATTYLSTKWKHLFASIPNLKLDLDCYSVHNSHFPAFVHSVLDIFLRDVRYIDTLYLHYTELYEDNDDDDHLTSWICSASRFEVRDLSMIVYGWDSFALPPSFWFRKTLVNLTLHGSFDLDIPGLFCLPNLEYLDLKKVVFGDSDSARRLFSGCPMLKTLIMDMGGTGGYDDLDVLDVSSPSLLVLEIRAYGPCCHFEIVLDTPILNTLRHYGYIATPYKVKNPHCLSVAVLSFNLDPEEFEDGARFVALCSEVRAVYLSANLMKAFHEFPQLMPTFPNLAELKLGLIDKYGWKVLPQLLEKSPSLKVLVFTQGISRYDCFAEFVSHLTDHMPMCFPSSLQEIEFQIFSGEEGELKLVEYFLKSARAFMKMKINCGFSSKRRSCISEKLLKLPKYSTTCEILIS